MNQFKQLHFAGVLGAVCATLAVLPAQRDVDDPAARSPSRVSAEAFRYTDLIGHWVEDGSRWFGGDRYAATYADGTLVYVPALGVKAPHTMPWRYAFARMERSGAILAEANASEPVFEAGGRRVRIARGPGIDEVHHVRPGGLEITYELTARPAGHGDLVVRAQVISELMAPEGVHGTEGLEFWAPGIGGIHLSGVFGVDARGSRVAGTLGWDGEQLAFTLPGGFLEDAAYPVVLDPLVSSAAEVDPANTGSNDTHPDIAFDLTNDVYGMCWQRVFSASSSQIRAARFDGTTYATVGTNFESVTNLSNSYKEKPAIANNNLRDQFLIAWAESTNVFAPRDVYCRSLDGAGGLSAGIVALATTPADEFEPDVGGDARGFDDECLVVWSDDSVGIRSAQVTVSAASDPSIFGVVQSVTTTASDRQPAIAKTMLASRTLCVWRNASGEIEGRSVSSNAAPLASETAITSGGLDDSHPDVDGDGSIWLVAWQEVESLGSPRHDIQCRLVTLSAADQLQFPEPAADIPIAAQVSDDERNPSVGIHKIRFVVAYEDETSNFASIVAASYIGRDTCRECEGRDLVSANNGFRNQLAAVCSRRSGGDANSDRGAIVWSETEVAPPFDGDGYIRGVQSAGDGTGVTNTGGACGSAGSISVGNGPAGVLGNLETTAELTGASITSTFAFLYGAVAFQPRVSCGPCQAIDPGLLNLNIGVPVNLGAATVRVPTPCNPNLAGITVEFQFIVFQTATVPCPLIPGLGVTDILRVQLTQ